MRELRSAPFDLRQSGVALGEIAAQVRSAFTASDARIAAARPGWRGDSAAALASVLTGWQRVTRDLHRDLVEHGQRFGAAARQYSDADATEADAVRTTAEQI